MADTIEIHQVEMWDHETEVVSNLKEYPPYERITITIHKTGGEQTRITLYQDILCDICGERFNVPRSIGEEKWVPNADKFAHKDCLADHHEGMDNWIDRYAARHKDKPDTVDLEDVRNLGHPEGGC